MYSLMPDNEIIKEIEKYKNHNYIWIEIWEINPYEIQLVITVNDEKLIQFKHKVLRINSLYLEEESAELIKERGREVKKMLKKHFKTSEIHSNLHYR